MQTTFWSRRAVTFVQSQLQRSTDMMILTLNSSPFIDFEGKRAIPQLVLTRANPLAGFCSNSIFTSMGLGVFCRFAVNNKTCFQAFRRPKIGRSKTAYIDYT